MGAVAVDDKELLLRLFDLPQDALNMIHEDDLYQTWYLRSATFVEMFTLRLFKEKYAAGDVSNFVYYRDASIIFSTLNPADHERFVSGLYNLHKLKIGERQTSADFSDRPSLTNMFCGKYDGLDVFLKEGLGVYQSSCGKDCYRHENFEFNAAEFEAFRSFPPYIYKF